MVKFSESHRQYCRELILNTQTYKINAPFLNIALKFLFHSFLYCFDIIILSITNKDDRDIILRRDFYDFFF